MTASAPPTEGPADPVTHAFAGQASSQCEPTALAFSDPGVSDMKTPVNRSSVRGAALSEQWWYCAELVLDDACVPFARVAGICLPTHALRHLPC